VSDLGGNVVGLVFSLSFCLSLSLSFFPKPSIGADKLNFLVARLRLELALAVELVLWLASTNEPRPTDVSGDADGRYLALVAGSPWNSKS
jgi:hypothetical protein